MKKKCQKSPISIVTGGRGGLGLNIVRTLTARGDTVYSLGRSRAKSNHIQVDVGSRTCSEAILCNIGKEKIDNLVFAHRYRGDDSDQDFEVSLVAIKKIVEGIEHRFTRKASIVLLSSVAAISVVDEQSSTYHATRAGLEGLARFFAVRLGPKGVRCNCVLPSTLIKRSNRNFFTKSNPVRQLIEEVTPLSRMGTATDIANAVEFLCSSNSSYITGQCLVIDGGLSLVNPESIARRLTGLKH